MGTSKPQEAPVGPSSPCRPQRVAIETRPICNILEAATRAKIIYELSVHNQRAFVLLNGGLELAQTVAVIHHLPLPVLRDFQSYYGLGFRCILSLLETFAPVGHIGSHKSSQRAVQTADMPSAVILTTKMSPGMTQKACPGQFNARPV